MSDFRLLFRCESNRAAQAVFPFLQPCACRIRARIPQGAAQAASWFFFSAPQRHAATHIAANMPQQHAAACMCGIRRHRRTPPWLLPLPPSVDITGRGGNRKQRFGARCTKRSWQNSSQQRRTVRHTHEKYCGSADSVRNWARGKTCIRIWTPFYTASPGAKTVW